jgi:hypothetical protein
MPPIRELIAIPERVHQGDFVLQLTKGVAEPQQTLRDYVVTPQLVDAFGNALGFIQQAVQTGASKAAYLHGSFGSGAFDSRAGRRGGPPRLDARPQVPARAVPHGRRARHGIGDPRPVRRVRQQKAP